MFVNKIGFEHMLNGTNCQDFGLDSSVLKCVVDGCSEGVNSEVGAKMFIHLLQKGFDIPVIFDKLTTIFTDYEEIRNHLLFTILLLEETAESFIVRECGDGYIILQRHDDTFEYKKIDYQGIPPYYAYNYIKSERLSLYKDGVDFNNHIFPKSDYKAVGIASDGLTYILESSFKDEVETLLAKRKVSALKRLINKNQNYQFAINTFPLNITKQIIPFDYDASKNNLRDDITIVI